MRQVLGMSRLAGVIAAVGAGFGFGAEMSAAATMAPLTLRDHRPHSGSRMQRRSTLSAKQRSYYFDPFTPAPTAACYGAQHSRQVRRQHERRIAKARTSREKRQARAAA